MGNKYLRREKARACPIHKAVLEACGQALVDKGYFSKEDILEKLRFTAMAESIRWDYVAEWLTADDGDYAMEIIPLAPRFFNTPMKKRIEDGLPAYGRYVAGGHGKRTAGYASVTLDGGKLAIKRAERFKSLKNGASTALENYVRATLKQADQIESENVEKLESYKESEKAA